MHWLLVIALGLGTAHGAPSPARRKSAAAVLSRAQIIERALLHVESKFAWARSGWRSRAKIKALKSAGEWAVWIDSPDRPPDGNPFFIVTVSSSGVVIGSHADW